MASVRGIKNDIDYLVSEIVSDCYIALYINGEGKRKDIIAVMEAAVAFYNDMYQRANHPADKKNKSLVKKHYAQMRRDMMTKVDDMFEKLSKACK